MNLFVGIEKCEGLISQVRVFASRQSAKEAEALWLCSQEIHDRETRESKAIGGTEFLIREGPLLP